MSQQEIQDLIDQSVSIAINEHNRNASMVSAALGFVFMGAFCRWSLQSLRLYPTIYGY